MSKGLFLCVFLLLWHLRKGSCASTYYYSRYKSSWPDAESDCNHIGGSLVNFDDAAELAYVTSFSNWVIDVYDLWIGLSDQVVEGDFRWRDNSALSFNPWFGTEPNGGGHENCVRLGPSHKIADIKCSNLHYFICEVISVNVRCPRNKIYFTPSHNQNYKQWNQADTFCTSASASLAKVLSEEERLMVNRFRLVKGLGNMWIGGSCNATGGVSFWQVEDCSTLHPILCEIDANLQPNYQACYWKTTSTALWPSTNQTCNGGGGTLANIKTIRHYERILPLVGSDHVFLGMSDPSKTWDFRWTDGSVMQWGRWPPAEPNHHGGFEPHGMLYHTTHVYNDQITSRAHKGICERIVPQLFYNADVTHADGRMTITCHEFCYFGDKTETKTWTCAASDQAETCICPGEWIILEPWLAHLNASILQDNDLDSCLDVPVTTPVLSLSYSVPKRGTFKPEANLQNGFDHLRGDVITVFTSSDLSNPNTTCQLSGPLVKCGYESGPSYLCHCPSACHVYVKVFRPTKSSLPLSVCELGIS